MKYFLAVDLGASSGRHIVGWKQDGEIKTKEVYRFANEPVLTEHGVVWDIDRLLREVIAGLRAAFSEFGALESLSIDSWGVDYVLMSGNKTVYPCFAYRNDRTETVIDQVHQIVPFEELYRRTGCQFQPFTSIYQLYADKLSGRLDGVTDFLMIPEYLIYRLTGIKAKAYAHATTTGLISAQTGVFDKDLLTRLELPEHLFGKISPAGTKIGPLLGDIARETGGTCTVVLGPGHDTACAVEGIPMEGEALYLSSGTWSLLGTKTSRPITHENSRLANCSNEGGVGYNRHQKDIMGLWLVQQLRKELCPEKDFGQIALDAERSSCDILVDANAPAFLAPESMKRAFDRVIGHTLDTSEDYFRCAYRSLAFCYREAIHALENNTGRTYNKLYIVGGGAKNGFLNRLTAEVTGKQVIALPIEGSAIGNLLVQMLAEQIR
ncbi:MAG: rhamnulokinase [Ruminococcaceae bacterium]|nr:rhamnulokinase [Oscillospiraceae bacterium]